MRFSTDAINLLVKQYFGIAGKATDLSGYDEWNYLITANDGKRYVFKVGTDQHGAAFLRAQVKITEHLALTSVGSRLQQHYPAIDEQLKMVPVLIDGKRYYLRLLNFLEGNFWAASTVRPGSLYADLGNFLGTMDRHLSTFSHPAMHRRYTWDISMAPDANRKLKYINDPHQKRIAGYFLLQFDTEVQPVLSSLRHAYVHNDANDYNLLVTNGKVSGLIDFGDMVYTALINNLAVACTYAMFDAKDPLHAASLVVGGYHKAYPLTEQETDLLYWLIAARLCISVAESAMNTANGSTNEHHFVTEKSAWELLEYLIRCNPVKAQEAFRKACGFASIIPENDYSELLAERKKYIGRNLSISYDQPLKITRGALQYLYDDKGGTFIDCVNNVSHVGHCHPVVVRRMQQQIARLNTNTRYLHDGLEEYAAALTATLPSRLKVCYFTNSGSEANDLAIRMSRHFTKQEDVIVLDHAYHGTSTVAIQISPYKFDGKGGSGQQPWVHKALSPDLYRGQYQYGDPQAGEKYSADVQRIIAELKQQHKAPAAFICETLLGVGGQIPLPNNYLQSVYEYVKAAGGVCIADEVQVGFGRVGEKFWGFQLQEVEPDIVVLGKPIGNGHPLAAVVVTEEIANAFNNGMEYFNTFGGNPVSMVTGSAVLNVIQDEAMQQQAKDTGDYLLQLLKDLMHKHPVIGDVRGHGLFVGAELVKNRTTKEPAVPEIDQVVQAMKARGFLLSTDGPLHNVLKIKPPLVFTRDNALQMVQQLDAVLSAMH